MPVKNALDAMNDALASRGVPVSDGAAEETEENEELPGEETGEETPPTGDDDAGGDEDGSDDDSGDEGTDEELADEEEGDEEEGDEEEGDEGEETEEGDEESETPEAKAAREKLEKAAERGTGDILEDPIPKDLNKRTQERITKLIDTVKTLQPDADIGRELIQHINASQMTGDEFSMALTFGRLKHSDNVEDNRKAYQILWQGLKELAPIVGETLPGVDPLEGHPDLQTRVTAKTLDAKDAAEIAAGRNRRKADSAAMQRAQQNAQTVQQREQQAKQLDIEVRKELNALGHQLSAQDRHFEAKMATLTQKQKAQIAATPPGLRVNAFLKTYLSLKVPSKVVPQAARKQTPQPMRAGKVPAAGGSGVRREAKSAVEAMDFALGLK